VRIPHQCARRNDHSDRVMEINQLESFVVVADELNFGRAAQRLHISTSALSRRIQALESAVGVQLFERTSRTVRLSNAGLVFAVRAKDLVANAEELRQLTREYQSTPM